MHFMIQQIYFSQQMPIFNRFLRILKKLISLTQNLRYQIGIIIQHYLTGQEPRSKTYGRKRPDPANFPRFPEAGFRKRFRAPVPIDFRQIPVSGPY